MSSLISHKDVRSRMTNFNTPKRKKIKKVAFGLPSERKYPINNKEHAINAKVRATQMVKKGKLSQSSAKKIKSKANRFLKNG